MPLRFIIPLFVYSFLLNNGCVEGVELHKIYHSSLREKNVLLCPDIYWNTAYPGVEAYPRYCDEGRILLRQNVKTGEVVQIHTCFQQCFVDVCVPEGEYKYDYKEPYTCPPDTEPMPPFQVDYYRTVFTKKWSDEELKTCLRKSNAKLPTPYEGEVPWRDHHVRNCGL